MKSFWKPFWYVVGNTDQETKEAATELGGILIEFEGRLICKLLPIEGPKSDRFDKPYIKEIR